MHYSPLKLWTALAAISLTRVVAAEGDFNSRYRLDGRSVLKPIHPAVLESAHGIEARNYNEYDHLSPGDHAQMVFGNIGNQGELHLANMTLYAMENLPIVMMERFEGLTSSVDCEGDDGRMSLTFRSHAAYEKALSKWSYINEASEAQFLMITNHDGCGPDNERQAYKITDVHDNLEKRTVFLAAKPANWKDIAGFFDVDFGTVLPTASATRTLQKRGFLDWVDDIADDIKNTFDEAVHDIENIGTGEISKSLDIGYSVGEENVESLLFEDVSTNPPLLKLYCTDCFAHGTFHTTGTLKVDNFVPETVLLEVLPENFAAAVEVRAELAISTPEGKYNSWNKTLIDKAIPYVGFEIPKILLLGTRFRFEIGGEVSAAGKLSVTVGAHASLPNGGRAALDLWNYENTGVSGFSSIQFDPVFHVDNAQVTVEAAFTPMPALVFGVEILENTGIEAALTLSLPRISANVSGGYDKEGYCKDKPDSGPWGVDAEVGADVKLDFSVEGEVDDEEHTFYTKTLWDWAVPWKLEKCWDFGDSPNEGTPTSPPGTNTTQPEDPGTGEDPGWGPIDYYYRWDCSTPSNGTGLQDRAPACTRYPVVKFSCEKYPNACKSMCFSRYCKGQQGNWPALLHRGAVSSGGSRRGQSGFKKPSQSRQPCLTSTTPNYNEIPTWTSMDEFPMAQFVEGGRHGDWGAGFRCIRDGENFGAGSYMYGLLNAAKVATTNSVSGPTNKFDIEFTDIGFVDGDYCNTDTKGKPTSQCINDGHQFIAQWKGTGNQFDYLLLNDGQGWTGTK